MIGEFQFRLLAYVVGFVVLALLAWRTIVYFEGVGYQRAVNHYEGLLADAQKASMLKERELQTKVNDAIQRSAEREKQHKAELAIADSANRRLRYGIEEYKRRLPTVTVATCAESASSIAELFGRCGEEYQRMAGIADKHANDAATCAEAWPK